MLCLLTPFLRASWCVQLGAEFALQRRQLLLFQHPLSTLWYFGTCAMSSAWRGMRWSTHHPVMLWCVIPIVAAYAAIKPSGNDISRNSSSLCLQTGSMVPSMHTELMHSTLRYSPGTITNSTYAVPCNPSKLEACLA